MTGECCNYRTLSRCHSRVFKTAAVTFVLDREEDFYGLQQDDQSDYVQGAYIEIRGR